ncbi:MAG: hypothetical protein JW750_10200 [Anaerolineaceae bacterium]|nr:hypothetical protein [Anaerolineaceae bacterium]
MMTETSSAHAFRPKDHPGWMLIIGVVLITLTSMVFYGRLLRADEAVPWASDAFGHIFRFEFLRESIAEGVPLPDFFPDWYLGIQLFRYYPPFVYYLLAGLSALLGDPVRAVFVFTLLCVWLGGISWLLFQRWIGWIPAILGGMFYLLLPDLVRVAFSEGNLLRVFANALLPLMFFFVYSSVKETRKQPYQIGTAVVFAALVLSHPMIAAITAVMAFLVLVCLWLLRELSFNQLIRTTAHIGFGILSVGFWLLPSLSSGITDLSREAVLSGLPVVSLTSLLNPWDHAHSLESLYVGYSLFAAVIIALFFRRVWRQKVFLSLTLVGLTGVLLVTPILSGLYNAAPLSNLLWAARYLSAASFFLLLAAMWFLSVLDLRSALPGVVVVLVLLFDLSGSSRLIYAIHPDEEMLDVSRQLADSSGWRAALLDFSLSGSQPSYQLTEVGQREQFFGWGFQGAKTAPLIVGVNEALQSAEYAYILDRLNLSGVDDVLLLNSLVNTTGLRDRLIENGFEETAFRGDQLVHLRRDGSPRAVVAEWKALVIGSVAQNYTFIFPQMLAADSVYLDDYSFDMLKDYDTLVLAGAHWHQKQEAEALVLRLAEAGVRVFVDLTKSQVHPLTRTPEFLKVWGEPVILDDEPMWIADGERIYQLSGMRNGEDLWYTYTPQNIDIEVYTHDFFNQHLVLAGYQQTGSARVWFLGLNLAYHVVENHDAEAAALLADLLHLPLSAPSDYQTIPLDHYQANGREISFDIHLTRDQALLLPFAHYDGTVVWVDGQRVESQSLSTLIHIHAPSGAHEVKIGFEPPQIYRIGWGVSVFALLVLAGLTIFWREE